MPLRNPERVAEIGELQEMWANLALHLQKSVTGCDGLLIAVIFQIDAASMEPVNQPAAFAACKADR